MSLKMSLETEKPAKTLSLPNTPRRFAQAMKRMRKLNKKQRAHYLEVLDDVLDQHISSQTGIPHGRLTDGMLEAIANGEQ